LFNFLVHEDTFLSIFSSKKFREKSLPKIYLGLDPDPDLEPDPDPVKNRPDPLRNSAAELCSAMLPMLSQVAAVGNLSILYDIYGWTAEVLS
jgi:hypothetical protein